MLTNREKEIVREEERNNKRERESKRETITDNDKDREEKHKKERKTDIQNFQLHSDSKTPL